MFVTVFKSTKHIKKIKGQKSGFALSGPAVVVSGGI